MKLSNKMRHGRHRVFNITAHRDEYTHPEPYITALKDDVLRRLLDKAVITIELVL